MKELIPDKKRILNFSEKYVESVKSNAKKAFGQACQKDKRLPIKYKEYTTMLRVRLNLSEKAATNCSVKKNKKNIKTDSDAHKTLSRRNKKRRDFFTFPPLKIQFNFAALQTILLTY